MTLTLSVRLDLRLVDRTNKPTCLIANIANTDDVVVGVVIHTLARSYAGVTGTHHRPSATVNSSEAIQAITRILIHPIYAWTIVEARVGVTLVCKGMNILLRTWWSLSIQIVIGLICLAVTHQC